MNKNSQRRGKYEDTRPGSNLGPGKRQQKKQQTANEKSNNNITAKNTEQDIRVVLVGDSQLRRLNAEKLSNGHHGVEIKAKPGLKIQQVA